MRRTASVCGKSLLLLLICCLAFAGSPASAAVSKDVTSADAERGKGGVILVLSGGGTKGFAHIGVMKVLEENNIPVVGIVGTSMGSVMGGLYACGYKANELQDIVLETNIMSLIADAGTRIKRDAGDNRPVGEGLGLYHIQLNKNFKQVGPLGGLPATSLVSFLTKYTANVQTTNFDFLPIPFACVATDLGTGEAVVMREGNLPSAIRASISIPGLLEPWRYDNKLLVDGGLVANLPVEIAKDIFPGYPVLAVNLSGQSIAKSNDRFSSVMDVLLQTIDIMTVESLKRNEAAADLVLYPEVWEYGMLDGGQYPIIIQKGYEIAQNNLDAILALTGKAPPPPAEKTHNPAVRIVREIKVEGLPPAMADGIKQTYGGWIGKPLDPDLVHHTINSLSKREDFSSVDVDIVTGEGENTDVTLVFSFARRSKYDIGFDGYSTNFHSHRWVSILATARDLVEDGDSANFEGRMGNEEWGAQLRYFTPSIAGSQWSFGLNARRDRLTPEGYGAYDIDRYSGRAIRYFGDDTNRFGIGLMAEHSNGTSASNRDNTWGPYLYFSRSTLDDAIAPTEGYLLDAEVWWNDLDIFVSRTNMTFYVPWRSQWRFVLSGGLETGSERNQAYRVLLGDQEELYSLARHPLAGDQAVWARFGLARTLLHSWWGGVMTELFGAYGMTMSDWSREEDAWEFGAALSVPGQFLNGRLIVVYDNHGEFTFGFAIGVPRWWGTPLP